MVEKANIGEGQSIRQIQPARSPVLPKGQARESFDAVMQKEIEKWKGVHFSAHALQRLSSRNISLSREDGSRIVEAIDRAQSKGARDSLVLVRTAALVVSVTNRTVVTALGREEVQGNVFTNIDSAVIMDGDEGEG